MSGGVTSARNVGRSSAVGLVPKLGLLVLAGLVGLVLGLGLKPAEATLYQPGPAVSDYHFYYVANPFGILWCAKERGVITATGNGAGWSSQSYNETWRDYLCANPATAPSGYMAVTMRVNSLRIVGGTVVVVKCFEDWAGNINGTNWAAYGTSRAPNIGYANCGNGSGVFYQNETLAWALLDFDYRHSGQKFTGFEEDI